MRSILSIKTSYSRLLTVSHGLSVAILHVHQLIYDSRSETGKGRGSALLSDLSEIRLSNERLKWVGRLSLPESTPDVISVTSARVGKGDIYTLGANPELSETGGGENVKLVNSLGHPEIQKTCLLFLH